MSLADSLAAVRALAAVPITWLILSDQREIALTVFFAAAATDALDGWLARRRGATALGALLDPLADKALVVGALVALTAASAGWPVTVVTILVTLREGAVALARVRAYSRQIALPADGVAKAKTAAEMAGVALIILGGRPWSVLGAGLVGLAFGVGLLTLRRYLRASP